MLSVMAKSKCNTASMWHCFLHVSSVATEGSSRRDEGQARQGRRTWQ